LLVDKGATQVEEAAARAVELMTDAPGLKDESAERPSRLGVLRHRHFRNVWFGAFGSSIGTWMESVGVQWLMAEQTGSARMMAYLAIAQLGPTFVLGLFAGVVADRVDRKRMLIVTQAIMMLVAAALMVTSWTGHATPRVLIGLMALHGITMAFNIPAWQVQTPRLVPRAELARAIALNGLQFNLARVVGPALGGILMAKFGPTILFAINTASFLGVIIAISRTPNVPPLVDAIRRSAIADIREALSWTFRNKGPLCVFIGLVLISILAGGPLLRMLPLFVSEVYGAGEKSYGLLLAMMGLGAVGGALALKLIPDWYPRHHFIPLSIAGSGASMLAFAVAPTLTIGSALMLLVGVFWIWTFNTSMAAMQLLVGDRMRGRVMAILNTVIFGAAPLGALLAAEIGIGIAGRSSDGDPTGRAVQFGVGILSGTLAVAGVVMLIWRTPEVDGIERGEPGYDRRPGLWNGLTARGHRPPPRTPSLAQAPGEELT